MKPQEGWEGDSSFPPPQSFLDAPNLSHSATIDRETASYAGYEVPCQEDAVNHTLTVRNLPLTIVGHGLTPEKHTFFLFSLLSKGLKNDE